MCNCQRVYHEILPVLNINWCSLLLQSGHKMACFQIWTKLNLEERDYITLRHGKQLHACIALPSLPMGLSEKLRRKTQNPLVSSCFIFFPIQVTILGGIPGYTPFSDTPKWWIASTCKMQKSSKIVSSLKKWVNSLGSSLWFQLASQKTIHHVVILYYSSKDEVAQPIEIIFSLQLVFCSIP